MIIDLNNGEQPVMVGFDSNDTVNVVPDQLSYMLEWSKRKVLALAEYRGWTVVDNP